MIWIENSAHDQEWWENVFYGCLVNNKGVITDLYHELLHADISSFKCGKCPTSQEQTECASEEASPLDKFIYNEFNKHKKGDYNVGKTEEYSGSLWICKKGKTFMNKTFFINNFKIWLRENHHDGWIANPAAVMSRIKQLPGVECKQMMDGYDRFQAISIIDTIALADYVETL